MKQLICIFLALLSSGIAVSAQVYSYYYDSRDAFCKFPQLKPVYDRAFIKSMPSFNVDSLLEEDRKQEEGGLWKGPFRFGYAFDVDYTLNDGQWTVEEDKRIWRLRFYSKGAYSLNFVFSEMNLSPDAELYIFSTYGYMVYGPVTQYQILTTGNFLSDLLIGDDVVIQLIESAATKEESKLRISRVVHGYHNTYEGRYSPPDTPPSTTPCISSYSDILTMKNPITSNSYTVVSGTNKQVTVSFPYDENTVPVNRTIAWSLYNSSGALAASGRIAAQGGTLNFGNLPSGIYVLSLDTEATPYTHKIVLK
ncbi:MAG: T9SS type A sorting domain-containing protein [Tannerellaceae bacterium]|jgi:hypothetical protein|nr:T9SS type A sorting domain-containing protein [Tannerellaceae bacterium]